MANLPERPVVLLSRTDRIGDVVLTFPAAGLLKNRIPACRVLMLTSERVAPVARMCAHVDGVIEAESWRELSEKEGVEAVRALELDAFVHVYPARDLARLALKAKVPLRIGTARRSFHLLTCNRKVNISRRKSEMHEAELNLELLEPLGIRSLPPRLGLGEYYGFDRIPAPTTRLAGLLAGRRRKVILHPVSGGSAAEWGLENFSKLIHSLPAEKFRVFVTGTEDEGRSVRPGLPLDLGHVTDLTGKTSLEELVSLIAGCDALVAASTGPLHLAAALGKRAVGLYSTRRPIHAGRWGPIGPRATALAYEGTVGRGEEDRAVRLVEPSRVLEAIESMAAAKTP